MKIIRLKHLIPRHKDTIYDEDFQNLKQDIRENGVRTPLLVSKRDFLKRKHHIIDGNRRYRAAQIVGLEAVPCVFIGDRALDKIKKCYDEVGIWYVVREQDGYLYLVKCNPRFQKKYENMPMSEFLQHPYIAFTPDGEIAGY